MNILKVKKVSGKAGKNDEICGHRPVENLRFLARGS
jgi:hypothetical protein